MSRKLTVALVFALVLTMAVSMSAFAQEPGQGAGACANFVDADGDGVCDLWVDADGDGFNDNAPRYGSQRQHAAQGRQGQNGQRPGLQNGSGLGTPGQGQGLYGNSDFVDANGDGVCDTFVDADGDGKNDSAPQDGTGNQYGRAAGRGAGAGPRR